LSNRKPPYPLAGGLYDALKDTDGHVILANNKQAKEASSLFQETEGNDLHPAAAVAVASLRNVVNEGDIENDALIMLNITGGGEQKFKKEKKLYYLKPSLVFDIDPDFEEVKKKLQVLFK